MFELKKLKKKLSFVSTFFKKVTRFKKGVWENVKKTTHFEKKPTFSNFSKLEKLNNTRTFFKVFFFFFNFFKYMNHFIRYITHNTYTQHIHTNIYRNDRMEKSTQQTQIYGISIMGNIYRYILPNHTTTTTDINE